jgi:membrane associated rhomboid family serine protease
MVRPRTWRPTVALLILGTLAGSVYPRATLRALPLLWGSGLGVDAGDPGTHHLGASGVAHGLMFLVFVLGLLRRDRASIAAGMIAFLFYGSMLIHQVLPHTPGVSWQSHLGGALAACWRRCCSGAATRRRRASVTTGRTRTTKPRCRPNPGCRPVRARASEVPVLAAPMQSRGVVLRFVRPPGEHPGTREP